MNERTFTAKQLARRRQLAAEQLLSAYQTEYTELLKAFGRRSPTLVKGPTSTELTVSQKSVLAARYEEFLKERLEIRELNHEEGTELEFYGVPKVCEERVETKGPPLSFAQAEAYLSQHISHSLRSARLEPHLLTSTPPATSEEPMEKGSEEDEGLEKGYFMDYAVKTAEMQRLEEFACSASFREMDREDFLLALLGKRGKYSIRQSSFVIGCSAQLIETNLGPSATATNIHKKQRLEGGLSKVAREIDVDLAKEGYESKENVICAQVWLKSDGRVCIKRMDTKSLLLDGKQVAPGKCAYLQHWSLLEIESVPLLTVINRHATERVCKRSYQEINI